MDMLVIIDMIPLHFMKVNEPKVISNFGSFFYYFGAFSKYIRPGDRATNSIYFHTIALLQLALRP